MTEPSTELTLIPLESEDVKALRHLELERRITKRNMMIEFLNAGDIMGHLTIDLIDMPFGDERNETSKKLVEIEARYEELSKVLGIDSAVTDNPTEGKIIHQPDLMPLIMDAFMFEPNFGNWYRDNIKIPLEEIANDEKNQASEIVQRGDKSQFVESLTAKKGEV